MIAWKHLFELHMKLEGRGVGPNGAYYQVTTIGPNEIPACIRTNLGKSKTVIGFAEHRFQTREEAMKWALADGNYLIAGPLRERYQVA
jgi:hypothetical protein